MLVQKNRITAVGTKWFKHFVPNSYSYIYIYIYIYIYSGLTKIRTRRRAADSTDSTEPIRLVLHHLRESFPLS
ncbi:predicted protein [Neisseria gonorrhoeae DGI2]|nr:predicted protein [Neisseria gonorrhoeae DGI2]